MPERKAWMELNIKYENGTMTIYLENFLSWRNISKVKKLVKIIRSSHTPECEGKIREYVEQEMGQFEPRQQDNEKHIVRHEEKIKSCQAKLDYYTASRDRHKKGSDSWKKHNQCVRQARQELRGAKQLLRSRQADYNSNIRKREFYQKVLKILV